MTRTPIIEVVVVEIHGPNRQFGLMLRAGNMYRLLSKQYTTKRDAERSIGSTAKQIAECEMVQDFLSQLSEEF